MIQGEQGLLLFTPNLQSFGALPRGAGGASGLNDSSRYATPDMGAGSPNENLPTIQSQQMGLQQFTRNFKSEEDIDDEDDFNDGDSHGLGAEDSLDRAISGSVRSLTQQTVTKVSSTRKLNDQGGEGFLHPSESLRDMDLGSQRNRKQSRNETFAAGSRAYLLTGGKSSAHSSAKKNTFAAMQSESQSSETFAAGLAQDTYQMSRTEAEHLLTSSLHVSAN